MRVLAYIIVIGIIGFTSCKKGKADFTIKGVITNNTFGSGLNGAKVKLYEIEAGGGSTNLLGETTIGSDGSYSFTFPRNKAESYLVTIRKEDYYDRDMPINFADLTIENDNIYNFYSTAKSWVRLKFITTNPAAEFRYIKQQGKEICDGCCSADEQFLYGVQDLTIICPNDGNTLYSYNYWVLGTPVSGVRSATTAAFDTVDIVLNY